MLEVLPGLSPLAKVSQAAGKGPARLRDSVRVVGARATVAD